MSDVRISYAKRLIKLLRLGAPFDCRRFSLTIWLLGCSVIVIQLASKEVQPLFEI